MATKLLRDIARKSSFTPRYLFRVAKKWKKRPRVNDIFFCFNTTHYGDGQTDE